MAATTYDDLIDGFLGSAITLSDASTVAAVIDDDQRSVEKFTMERGFLQPLRDPALFYLGSAAAGLLEAGDTFTYAGTLYRASLPPAPVLEADTVVAVRILASKVLSELQFPNLCDLWHPTVTKTGRELAGVTFTLYAHNQACLFISTPEVDVPEAEGRSKEVNIFTLDQFLVPTGVPIRDGWVIKLLSAGDNQNLFWSVQGNPQSNAPPQPYWPVLSQMVYAKRLPKPPTGVS